MATHNLTILEPGGVWQSYPHVGNSSLVYTVQVFIRVVRSISRESRTCALDRKFSFNTAHLRASEWFAHMRGRACTHKHTRARYSLIQLTVKFVLRSARVRIKDRDSRAVLPYTCSPTLDANKRMYECTSDHSVTSEPLLQEFVWLIVICTNWPASSMNHSHRY